MKEVNSMIDLFGKIDALIRSGQLPEAQSLIKKNTRGSLSREQRLRLASLARRANLFNSALRLLIPILHPKKRKIGEGPTDQERTEYAASLIRLGATEEALSLLKEVNTKSVPEALLFEAIANFSLWDYRRAIDLLKEFIKSENISNYQRMVGKVNLVAALIHEEMTVEAHPLLEELKRETKKADQTFLFGKLKYYAVELAVNERNHQKALELIKDAEDHLSNASSLDKLLIASWQAIANLSSNPSSKEFISEINSVKDAARKLGHFETVRNCDFYKAVFCRDKKLAIHILAGTPHEGFKNNLLKKMGANLAIPENYIWRLGKGGENTVLHTHFKAGTNIGRLLSVLMSDFYTAFRSVELYAKVFPDNFYNPDTSPYQIRGTIKLLRAWLRKNKLPLQVEQVENRYRITGNANLLVKTRPETTELERVINTLRQAFQGEFTTESAVKILKKPHRTALRFLTQAVANQTLDRSGAGRATRYRFKIQEQPFKKSG